MRLLKVVDERFADYWKISMMLATCFCNWKCCKEAGLDISVCQNQPLSQLTERMKDYTPSELYERYRTNGLTSAIVVGGLEPMLQFDELIDVISYFREHGCDDEFVIYTGYTEAELTYQIQQLSKYKNIIIKFGRFVPNQWTHFDPVLRVDLASENQYARRIS